MIKRLLHLSDLHIGESEQELRALRALVKSILSRPDVGELALAITGDLTHGCKPEEWAQLRRALAPLRGSVPVYAVAGNHDCGELGITYDAQRARFADHQLRLINEPARWSNGLRAWREVGGCTLLGLDSQRGNSDDLLPPLARGEIGKPQLASLAVALQDEDAPIILLLHHHPRWSQWAHVLEDVNALLALVLPRKQVRAVLYGHRHHAAQEIEQGRLWLASGKSTAAQGSVLTYSEIELSTFVVHDVQVQM